MHYPMARRLKQAGAGKSKVAHRMNHALNLPEITVPLQRRLRMGPYILQAPGRRSERIMRPLSLSYIQN